MREQTQPALERVFVNRTLNLNHIKLVGFDMDYTLVTYNVPAFEAKAYQIVLEKLVKDFGYPAEISALEFDPDFIIRGLVIDTDLGNVLKVNGYGYVKKTTHGTRPLSIDEQKKIYPSNGIDLLDPRFYIIHTLFSLAEGCLFAQIVDVHDRLGKAVNCRKLFAQIRAGMDDAHGEGSLKGAVINEPETYLLREPGIPAALEKLRHYGKKIALITNSDYEYSQQVMEYCFHPYLKGQWQDLFHIIVVGSAKPNFFLQQQKFLKVDAKTGLLSNFHAPIAYGNIYQGGNARAFERDLGLQPSEILYLGDHIHGDVVTLKETIGWRTGLVVQELKTEVPALERNVDIQRQIVANMNEKETLETQFYTLKEALFLQPRDKRDHRQEKQRDALREKIAKIDETVTALIDRDQKDYNRYWGEVMRSGNEESRFATIVERYACIYMSSIANLGHYSPFKYFRPHRRYLAHDPHSPYACGPAGESGT